MGEYLHQILQTPNEQKPVLRCEDIRVGHIRARVYEVREEVEGIRSNKVAMNNIDNSKGVNKKNCNGINWSDGINWSGGINWSDGISRSYGINESYGISRSYGINRSCGINKSNGINGSNGINNSYGINGSYGINRSYGVLNSYGVDHAIFLADKKRTYSIFGVMVAKGRFDEVWETLHKKLQGWYPKFNNAFELYLQAGNDWEKVKVSEITDTLVSWEKPYEAWKDMPKEAIDYVRSLPEFDVKMFERITGIKTNDKKKALLSKVDELLKKAEELRKEAEEL